MKEGWKRDSGALNLSLPIVITWPGGSCSGHLLLEVKGHVAELLLDVPHDLPLGGGGEAVAPLSEQGHQLVCQVAASQVQPGYGVRQGIALIDGNTVGDAEREI